MKHTGLKRLAAGAMAAVMLVIPVVAKAGFAPERPTYTYQTGFTGPNHPVFNSIVNNPSAGDERYFFTGRDNSVTSGGWSDPINNVQNGKEYKLRIYVHNNANDNLNADGRAIAHNTKVKVTLPTETAKSLVATAAISADNATPQTVTDTLNFNSSSNVKLSYVPGSAMIVTNAMDHVKLSDNIVTTGATVGSESLNGDWLGCFGHSGWVYVTVKASAPVTPPTPPTPKPTPTPQPTPVTPAAPATNLPETGMESAAAGALGTSAIGVTLGSYLRSKRSLVRAMRGNSSN